MFVKHIVCKCGEKLDEKHVVDRSKRQVTTARALEESQCLNLKCPGCGQKIMVTVLSRGK